MVGGKWREQSGGREGCYKYLPWQWPAFREAQWELFGVSSSCVVIRKLVIIRVKAVTMSQLSWCVSWHRGNGKGTWADTWGKWENHSSWRQRMEKEKGSVQRRYKLIGERLLVIHWYPLHWYPRDTRYGAHGQEMVAPDNSVLTHNTTLSLALIHLPWT